MHVTAIAGDLVDAFEEVETGKLNSRPALAKALAACRAMHATLSSPSSTGSLAAPRSCCPWWRGAGRGVVFCDLPQVPPGPSGKFVIAIMAAVAELEAGLISERTKAALAQAKARGVRLGNPRLQPGMREQALQAAAAKQRQAADRAAQVRPYIEAARKAGARTLAQLAEALNARGSVLLVASLACRDRVAAGETRSRGECSVVDLSCRADLTKRRTGRACIRAGRPGREGGPATPRRAMAVPPPRANVYGAVSR